MEPRAPAHLRVRDPVRREVLDELARHAPQRVRGLQYRDRQVEETEQLRLVRASGRADHPPPGLVERQRQADVGGELHGRGGPDRSVEVLVQLGLRERAKRRRVHRPMIGTRRAVTFAVALVALVAVLGPGVVRPEVGLAADAFVVARAEEADLVLAELQGDLHAALEEGRNGAASIVAGDEPPGPKFRDSAELTLVAAATSVDVDVALAALDGARAARGPVDSPIPPGTSAPDLASIAAQLEGVAEPADEFATMRRWAAAVPVALEAALAALRNGDLSEAEAQLALAREAHDKVAGWDVDFVTLPIWIETSDATIEAVEEIVAAARAGRTAEAQRLADEFAELADEAVEADRALQIAISEGGGLVAAAPLSRLVAAKRAVDAQRAAVRELLAEERAGRRRRVDHRSRALARILGGRRPETHMKEPERMRLRAVTDTPESVTADVLAVPIYREDGELSGDLAELNEASGGALRDAIDWGEFNLVEHAVALVDAGDLPADRLLLLNGGTRGRDAWRARRLAAMATRRLNGRGARSVALWLRDGEGRDAWVAAGRRRGRGHVPSDGDLRPGARHRGDESLGLRGPRARRRPGGPRRGRRNRGGRGVRS